MLSHTAADVATYVNAPCGPDLVPTDSIFGEGSDFVSCDDDESATLSHAAGDCSTAAGATAAYDTKN